MPLVVLITTDPWRNVIGSDSPTFALYGDGTAIFRGKNDFRSVKVPQVEMKALTEALTSPELAAMSGQYEATGWSDQPDNNLLVYGGRAPFYLSVYGSLSDAEVRSKVPDAVLAAFDRLRRFSAANGQPWLPDRVEVMIWPYEHAPDPSIAWPTRWPALTSATTRKRGDGYSIFVPSDELPALTSFLAGRKPRGAVEIGGKKWSASVRIPFPHEKLWMAPNDEAPPAKAPTL